MTLPLCFHPTFKTSLTPMTTLRWISLMAPPPHKCRDLVPPARRGDPQGAPDPRADQPGHPEGPHRAHVSPEAHHGHAQVQMCTSHLTKQFRSDWWFSHVQCQIIYSAFAYCETPPISHIIASGGLVSLVNCTASVISG